MQRQANTCSNNWKLAPMSYILEEGRKKGAMVAHKNSYNY